MHRILGIRKCTSGHCSHDLCVALILDSNESGEDYSALAIDVCGGFGKVLSQVFEVSLSLVSLECLLHFLLQHSLYFCSGSIVGINVFEVIFNENIFRTCCGIFLQGSNRKIISNDVFSPILISEVDATHRSVYNS